MNKNILIGIGIVVVILVGFGLFKMIGGGSVTEDITPTPTPTPAYEEVGDEIDATLTPNASKKLATLEITGLTGQYESLEYELTFMTESGPKGLLSGAKKIELDPDEETFERDIELGTCSTGGKCTFYKEVSNFKLFVKFHTPDGKIQVLRKEFEEI